MKVAPQVPGCDHNSATIFRLVRKCMGQPGTLAACCKPSSGAGVVWMDIPLRGWVQTPAMKNGDRLKVLLPLSHYTRAPRMPEERKTEESLVHVMWSARS